MSVPPVAASFSLDLRPSGDEQASLHGRRRQSSRRSAADEGELTEQQWGAIPNDFMKDGP